MKKQEVIESAEALIEMYKAGFLDGYKVFGAAKTKADYEEINKEYARAFNKRFKRKILKALKNK